MRFPKLSESLPFERSPAICQACGLASDETSRWRECDDQDNPGRVVVVLCQKCSDALIADHPRLYIAISRHDPAAGAMPLCIDCIHRRGTACPLAKSNGGDGVHLTILRPTRMHLNYGGGKGRWITDWPASPIACQERSLMKEIDG